LNFNFKTEGFLKLARAIEPFDIFWVEIDTRDAKALHYIRSRANIPVASCECLFGRRDYRPYFEAQSVDVAIIDTPWNGVAESVKIAAMADAYEVNVAPHNFYGHLATLMNAHFCAVVPNLRIMEIDPDVVPWYDELVTHTPDIKDGHLTLSSRPGWRPPSPARSGADSWWRRRRGRPPWRSSSSGWRCPTPSAGSRTPGSWAPPRSSSSPASRNSGSTRAVSRRRSRPTRSCWWTRWRSRPCC